MIINTFITTPKVHPYRAPLLFHKHSTISRVLYYDLIMYLIVLTGLLPLRSEAQWERVPLRGGHIDKYVPSPYDSNLVFAVTRAENIYYTKERSKNWKPLFDNLTNKPVIEILDMAITKRGSLILLSAHTCWRSEDFGLTWTQFTVPGGADPREILATKSGKIFVFNIGNGAALYSSDDDGHSWSPVTTPGDFKLHFIGFYVDPDFDNLLIIYAFGGRIAQSADGGSTWSISSQFDDQTQFVRPCRYIDHGAFVFGLIASGRQGMHYFTSTDSGKTWIRKDRICPYVNGGFSLYSMLLIRPSNVILLAAAQQYFISFNGGLDWRFVGSLYPWCFLDAGDTILGSFTLTGISRSTDEGVTWDVVESDQNISTFRNLQYRAADRDIGFAIVNDEDEIRSLYELRQTTDRGISWKTLFSSTALDQLFVRSHPEARYYVMSRSREIITGAIDQTVPDTIVTWKENDLPSYFVSTYAFPEYMYVSSMTEPWLGTLLSSWNGGSTWEESSLPFGWYRRVTLTPSIIHPDVIVGVCYPTFGSVDDWIGTYVNPHLTGWIQKNQSILNCSLVENDLLFQGNSFSFSTDYGSSWSRNLSGLDSTFNQSNVSFFMSRDRLFICTDWKGQKFWYYFQNGSWHPVRDGTGTPVQSPAPGSLEMIDDDLYATYPYQGLFRLTYGFTTGVDRPENSSPQPSRIACFPNPFRTSTELAFTLPERAKVTLLVVDIFGRTVARLVDEEKDPGNHRIRFDGGGLANGIYYYHLTSKNISLLGKMCLVR